MTAPEALPFARTHVLVLVGSLNAPALRRIGYARSLRPTSIEAVHVAVNPGAAARVRDEWHEQRVPAPLTLLERSNADIVRPVLRYVHEVASSQDLVVVVLPAFAGWWARLTQSWKTARLRHSLVGIDGVVVALVRWEDA